MCQMTQKLSKWSCTAVPYFFLVFARLPTPNKKNLSIYFFNLQKKNHLLQKIYIKHSYKSQFFLPILFCHGCSTNTFVINSLTDWLLLSDLLHLWLANKKYNDFRFNAYFHFLVRLEFEIVEDNGNVSCA